MFKVSLQYIKTNRVYSRVRKCLPVRPSKSRRQEWRASSFTILFTIEQQKLYLNPCTFHSHSPSLHLGQMLTSSSTTILRRGLATPSLRRDISHKLKRATNATTNATARPFSSLKVPQLHETGPNMKDGLLQVSCQEPFIFY